MIGIVIVSHSQKLAEGVIELAGQMTRGSVAMEAAGGIDDPENPIGTDPMKVMAAIESVAAASEDGVLVIMDLGSALMSAETALDFLPDDVRQKVLLCSAPIVEGTMAAAVQASVGASLQEASAEANTALDVKIQQLAPVTGESVHTAHNALETEHAGDELQVEMRIANKLGLHARPAAKLVSTAGRFQANILIRKGERSASAKSINQVALLSVKQGEDITVTVSGPDARQAIDALVELHKDNFGERHEDMVQAPLQAPAGARTAAGLLGGIPASGGYAVGTAYVHKATLPKIERKEIASPEKETVRLDQAIETALADIEALQRETEKTSGKTNAAIFEVHAMILGDQDMRDKAVAVLSSEKVNAEFAWLETMNKLVQDYRNLDDTYMQARAADVLDCGGRVLRILAGEREQGIHLEEKSILVAHDLTPSAVAGLDSDMVMGVITEVGGATSHAAILSRSMGIPAVIGVGKGIEQITPGKIIAMDGFTGTIQIDPDQSAIDSAEKKRTAWLAERETAKAKGTAPARTLDGRDIMVMGNIGIPADAPRAREFGAEGVGLFRTEFLFLDREEAPNEDEQFAAYVDAAKAMQGSPVIIRTLDIGGDKPVKYLDTPREDNPFLGERGVRFCMARPDLFRVQLRALLRAASQERIWIMYPMISDADELSNVLHFQAQVREELLKNGVIISDRIKTGIMIEVPAAVAVADKLAALSDFFSIGTNDLTQYVMAADRGNTAVSKLCDSLNPAVLRMIAMTCSAAKSAGIEVGMCGELAGNVRAVPLLLGLGLEELSMNAPAIPDVKEAIRSVTMDDCTALAQKALAAGSGDEVRELLKYSGE